MPNEDGEIEFTINELKAYVWESRNLQGKWGWELFDDGSCVDNADGFDTPCEAQQDAMRAYVEWRDEEDEREIERQDSRDYEMMMACRRGD